MQDVEQCFDAVAESMFPEQKHETSDSNDWEENRETGRTDYSRDLEKENCKSPVPGDSEASDTGAAVGSRSSAAQATS